MNKPKLMVLDRYGWPVERIKGRPIRNLLRMLIHGRRIARWPSQTAGSVAAPAAQQEGE